MEQKAFKKKKGAVLLREDIEQALRKNKELNRFFTTLMFKGMIKGLEDYLKPDETVVYIRNANVQMNSPDKLEPNSFSIKGKQPAVIAITDKRVLVYHKIFPNEKMEQFPVQEIRSYDFNKGLTSSKFRITTLTKSIDIDLTCNVKEARHLNSILENITRMRQSL